MRLTRAAYLSLIDEDLDWLARQPRCLERAHIEAVLRASVHHEYPTVGPVVVVDIDHGPGGWCPMQAEGSFQRLGEDPVPFYFRARGECAVYIDGDPISKARYRVPLEQLAVELHAPGVSAIQWPNAGEGPPAPAVPYFGYLDAEAAVWLIHWAAHRWAARPEVFLGE